MSPRFVDEIDERGERRRLARSGWPRHEDDSVLQAGGVGNGPRQAKVGHRRNRGRNQAHHHGKRAALAKDVDAEAGDLRGRKRQVAGALVRERSLGLHVRADQVGGNAVRVLRPEHREPRHRDRDELAVFFNLGRTAGGEDEIADALPLRQHCFDEVEGGNRGGPKVGKRVHLRGLRRRLQFGHARLSARRRHRNTVSKRAAVIRRDDETT